MNRQLPAGACIRHALNSVRNNIAFAFRISWPWYAVIALVNLVSTVIGEYVSGGNVEAYDDRLFPLYLVVGLINILGFASIAVNWHRYILLDEIPRSSDLFRLDDKTLRYFGNVLLITLTMIVVGIVIVLPIAVLAGFAQTPSIVIIGFLISLPVMMILFYRFSVKLPAIALGRRDFLFRDAWSATRGNSLSIFLVALFQVLAGIGIFLALSLLVLGLVTVDEMLAVVLITVIQLAVGWVFAIFGITILTSLYGFFVENRDF
jgi:hypothetical protein